MQSVCDVKEGLSIVRVIEHRRMVVFSEDR